MNSTYPDTLPQGPLLDPQHLEAFIELGTATYLEILDDAIQQIPLYLDHIRTAIVNGSIPQLNASAHRLRGSMLTFGCVALSDRCAHLEGLTTLMPGQAAAIHAELLALWKQSLTAIREWEQSVPQFAA